MQKIFLLLGAVSAFLAVAAGAFGAHALGDQVEPGRLEAFETGVRYQMYHALALLGLAWAVGRWPDSLLAPAGWLFVGGTVLFSGSLYILVLADLPWMGAVTPFGGLSFLGGWLLVAATAVRG